jgi:hypothetical protein
VSCWLSRQWSVVGHRSSAVSHLMTGD